MADKKECGTEVCHGRTDAANSQSSTSSNSYGYRKQQKNKGSSSSKDKRGQSRYTHSPKALQPRNGTYRSPRFNGSGQTYDQRSSYQRTSHSQKGQLTESKLKPASTDTPVENGQGGKKKSAPTSLNYLLNFTIAPAERRSSVGPGSLPPVSSGRRRRVRNSHSFNKEQFLQANCQFVVVATGDYSVHNVNPDLLVDWDHIEQVRLFCHQIPSCPICLYPPRAAKITRCGHVYCWSCVLHYLSLGDKKWRKCPICYESIYKKDLKSVTALSSHQYTVGDTVTMRLMARRKGTTLALPVEEWPRKKDDLLTLQDDTVNQFAKLLSATPGEVLSLITAPERRNLETQLAAIDNDSASEQCFVEAALSELAVREVALRQAGEHEQEAMELTQRLQEADSELNENPIPEATPLSVVTPTWTSFAENYFESHFEPPFLESEPQDTDQDHHSSPQGTMATDKQCTEENKSETQLSGSAKEGAQSSSSDPLPASTDDKETSSEQSSGDTTPESPRSSSDSQPHTPPHRTPDQDLTYFYQACDGQHLFLHPVNAKCLMREYGGLEHSPEEIKATIVEMDRLSMSEDVRSRYRYLSHLPVTCELALVELDIKPPLLSRATLAAFSEEISGRRQKRMKKKREERRRERKNEAKDPQPEFSFIVPTSAHQLTPEVFHDFLSLTSSPTSRPQPAPESGGLGNHTPSAPSFAQALQGKPPPIWPVQTPPKSKWSNGSPSTKVVGTKMSAEPDQEEEGVVPTFKDAFNEALASASVSVQNVSEGKPGHKTAKKGRKKMVLFSTGSTRGTS